MKNEYAYNEKINCYTVVLTFSEDIAVKLYEKEGDVGGEMPSIQQLTEFINRAIAHYQEYKNNFN